MDNKTIDIAKVDTCYESLRLKNALVEGKLLSSIAEKGVQTSIKGVFNAKGDFTVIDGFKRYRCSKKLRLDLIPIEEIGLNKIEGILNLIKTSNETSLHILEQAKLVDELHDNNNMSVKDIAKSLDKSSAWVSTRLGILSKLTPKMYELIQKDSFPARSYMYTLHQLTRVNDIPENEIEDFMIATSGKGLSGKDIDLLANGYFKGGQELKDQIKNGNLSWSINKLKDFNKQSDGLKDDEKRILKDLEIASKYIGRIIFKIPQIKKSNQLFSTAGLLAEGILNKLDIFQRTLKTLIQEVENDQRGQSKSDMVSLSRRDKGR